MYINSKHIYKIFELSLNWNVCVNSNMDIEQHAEQYLKNEKTTPIRLPQKNYNSQHYDTDMLMTYKEIPYEDPSPKNVTWVAWKLIQNWLVKRFSLRICTQKYFESILHARNMLDNGIAKKLMRLMSSYHLKLAFSLPGLRLKWSDIDHFKGMYAVINNNFNFCLCNNLGYISGRNRCISFHLQIAITNARRNVNFPKNCIEARSSWLLEECLHKQGGGVPLPATHTHTGISKELCY